MKSFVSVLMCLVLASGPAFGAWSSSYDDGILNTNAGDDSDTNYTSFGTEYSEDSGNSQVWADIYNSWNCYAGAADAYVDLGLGSPTPGTAHTCSSDGWVTADIDNDSTDDTVTVTCTVTLSVQANDEDDISFSGSADFGNISFAYGFDNGTLWIDTYDGSSWTLNDDTDSGGSSFSVTGSVSGVTFAKNTTGSLGCDGDLSRLSTCQNNVSGRVDIDVQ